MALTRATIEKFYHDLEANGIVPTVEKYYADNATLGEAGQDAKVGKKAILEAESGFAGMLEPTGKFRLKIHDIIVQGDKAVIEHEVGMKFKGAGGNEVVQPQVSIQEWHNGKIVKERFWHVKK